MTGDELRTSVETIWQEVLGADVDDDTDFFGAGGHSFAALRLIALVNNRQGAQMPVKALFDNPRFADFVAALDKELELSPQG